MPVRNKNRENIAQREIITWHNIYIIQQFTYVHLAFHSACHIIVELWLFKAPRKPDIASWSNKSYALRTEKSAVFAASPKDTVVRMLRISWNALNDSSFFWHKQPVQNILSTSLCIIIQQVTHTVCGRLRMSRWNHPECA